MERAHYESKDKPPVLTRAGLDAQGRIVTWHMHRPLLFVGTYDKTFTYRPDGTIEITEVHVDRNGRSYPAERCTVTPQQGPDPKVEDHLPAVEAHLIAEIPRVIKAAKRKDRAYALILTFSGTVQPVPAAARDRHRAGSRRVDREEAPARRGAVERGRLRRVSGSQARAPR